MSSESTAQEQLKNPSVSTPSSPLPSRKRTPKKLGPKSQANNQNYTNGSDQPPLPYRTTDTQQGPSQTALGLDHGSQSHAQAMNHQSQSKYTDERKQKQGQSPSQSQSRRRRSRGRRRGKGKVFGTDTSGSESQLYHSELSATRSQNGPRSRKRQPSDARSAASSEISEEAPQGGRKNRTASKMSAADLNDEQPVLNTVEENEEPDDELHVREGASSLGSKSTTRRRTRAGAKGIAKKAEGGDAVPTEERREEEKTLKLRLDLDLDLEIELKALIKGSVTLSLLT